MKPARPAKAALTLERLKAVCFYDPETGRFEWFKDYRRHQRTATKTADGYLCVRIDGKSYRLHRLAWFYVHGKWPTHQLDHKNGNRADNRLRNLREATHAENMKNRRRHRNNSSGFKGVYPCSQTQKFRAQICVGGKNRSLGYFDTAAEAHTAYVKAASKLHGHFASAGTN